MEKLVVEFDRRLGRKVVMIQIIVSISLALFSLAAAVGYIHDITGSRIAIAILGVDEENSIPTWWSAVILALLGILTAVVGTKRARDRVDLFAWFGYHWL